MDRETLSLPVANSQFYTAAVSSISNMLSPIAQTPVEAENKDILCNFANSVSAPTTSSVLTTPNTPVFELTEEVKLFVLIFYKLGSIQFPFFLAHNKTTTAFRG